MQNELVKCGVELKDGAKFCKICGAPHANGHPMVPGQPAGKIAIWSLVFSGIRFLGWIAFFIVSYRFHTSLRFDHSSSMITLFQIVFFIIGFFNKLFECLVVAFGAVAVSKRQYLGIVGIVLLFILYFADPVMQMLLFQLMK